MTYILPFVITVGFTVWTLAYLLNPQFHREDWKSLAAALEMENMPVYMIMSSSDPVRYYAPDVEVRDLRSLSMDPSLTLRMTPEPIIIIPYTADIHGVVYRIGLEGAGFQNHTSQMRRNVWYELWTR